jgi:dihydroorotate dehydrogenase electron transfer subunit
MHDLRARAQVNRMVASDMYVLALEVPAIAAEVRPGQFVNLGLLGGPLLRRPFSVYRTDGDVVELVLKPVGAGTRALLREPVVSCLGPLGTPFDIDAGAGRVTLVSGGVGVAPMPLAAAEAKKLGLRVSWVHGARSAHELCGDWAGDDVRWSTDDGSRGVRGTALDAMPADPGLVLACGPNPMLAALAAVRPDAQVSVETYMGCGTGVCLGCAVPLQAGGYDRACSEGPVYRAGDIDWKRLPGHLQYEVA